MNRMGLIFMEIEMRILSALINIHILFVEINIQSIHGNRIDDIFVEIEMRVVSALINIQDISKLIDWSSIHGNEYPKHINMNRIWSSNNAD